MMEKTFDPAAVEARVAAAWDEAEAFKAGRADRKDAKTFTIVIPPPNVTGNLHMGHALNNTLQDILCRFERMRGKDVLWQPGTDHAGIATQMVVERQLAERGEPDRRALGREAFLEKVWRWKEESGGAIIGQLKRLGASCDWSRERFTMGNRQEGEQGQMQRAVMKVFVQLYNEGLIYRDKRLVNWDPHFQTAISDLEVVQVECKGSFAWERGKKDKEGAEIAFDAAALGRVLAKNPNGHLYYFDYPIVDEAGVATGEVVTVATTRPETMLGDTGVAVHPDNEKLKHLIGKRAKLPLVGRLIPIIGDDYADPEKGTGAVKITPAHDFNDFEVGKRHGLAQINVLDGKAAINIAGNSDFFENTEYSKIYGGSYGVISKLGSYRSDEDNEPIYVKNNIDDLELDEVRNFDGLDRFEARTKIVSQFNKLNLLAKVEPHSHMVPHGDRSGVVIEPYLTVQWYVDAKTLAKPALDAVRKGKTGFIPKNWEKTYFEWLENIQPWCVSRQLWWGHQIPVWYGLDGEVFAATSEKQAIADAEAKYGEGVDVVTYQQWFAARALGSAHAHVGDQGKFMGKRDPRDQRCKIYRDPDVLDTWFSSALWPFSTLGWPDDTPEVRRYYPTSTLVTGFDIIFFWVARMMMMGLHFMKEVPFKDIYIHALVRDEKGAKMSKSKGNVIDPLALVDRFGADALRFTLCAMAAQGRDIKLSTSRVEGYRNFATKLWNAARFAEMNGALLVPEGFDPRHLRESLNQWALGELGKARQAITAAIEAYRFNDAANAAYQFVWGVYCDWYLELAKPVLQGGDGVAREETRATTAFLLREIVKLLHPFMPFLTEEIWASIKPAGEGVLALAAWPGLDGLDNGAAEDEIGWVVDLVSEIRSLRSEMNVPGSAQMSVVLVGADAGLQARAHKWQETLARMARTVGLESAASPPAGAAQFLVRGTVVALPLAGIIDLAHEAARLKKEIVRLDGEIAKTEAKLGNKDFVARAPEEIVEENRERVVAWSGAVEKLKAALARVETAL
ncbi:MAG: valine--tRNA ligase [Hyphomicrobiales bacterium]|nr:valine--tRNA ligase [Hyphomicrobiales bacterium]